MNRDIYSQAEQEAPPEAHLVQDLICAHMPCGLCDDVCAHSAGYHHGIHAGYLLRQGRAPGPGVYRGGA